MVALSFLLVTSPARGSQSELSWTGFLQLYLAYEQGSSISLDVEKSQRQYRVSSGWKFDPVFQANQSTTKSEQITSKSDSLKVSQSIPIGTTVSWQQTRTTNEGELLNNLSTKKTTDTTTVSQQILKDGLMYLNSSEAIARLEYELGLLKSQQTQQDNLYRATESYINAHKAKDGAAASRQSLTRAEEQHTNVQQLVESGYKAKADLLVSEAALIRAQLTWDSARNNLNSALDKLTLSLGRPDPILAEHLDSRTVPDDLIAKLESLTRLDSPWTESRKNELDLQVAQRRYDAAARGDLPSLSVSWSQSRSRDENEEPDKTTNVGVAFSLPLVSAIRRDGTRIAYLNLLSAQRKHQEDAIAANQKKKQSLSTIEQAKALSGAAEKLQILAKKTLEIEQQKYADGKTSVNQLRNVQDDYTTAELNAINRRSEYILRLMEYAKEIGQLHTTLFAGTDL